MTVVKRVARLLLLIVLTTGATLWLRQPAMLFYPVTELVATPFDVGLAYEEVKLSADSIELHGWYLPNPGSERTLLFFHGNAGNISHRLDSLQIFHRLGLNVLIIDYRGYGRSGGTPSEEGLYQDGKAAWRYLTERRGDKAENIVIFGRSLGAAVAARMAEQEQPAALIIESGFTSVKAMAREHFPLLSWMTPLRYRFDTEEALGKVHCPVLVAHSREDEISPFAFGEKLFQAAHEPKRFLTLKGDHNSGFLQSQPAYEEGLRAFLSQLVFHPNTK